MTALPAQRIAHGALVIGASEMGVVMGESPYKTPIELWREKRGELPGFEGNAQTEWGHDVEPAIRQWYVRQAGRAVYVPPESLFHLQHAWMRSTPDGLALRDPTGDTADPRNWELGFEAKKCSWRLAHLWGEAGTDEVPPWYLIQCQQGMAVTGLSTWHLAVSIGGEPPVVYVIRRDDELIAMMVEAGADFVRRVESGEPPEIDGSDAWKAYLVDRYPWTSDDYVEATLDIEVIAEDLRETQEIEKKAKGDIDFLKNKLLEFAGSHAGILTSIGKINTKPKRGNPDYKGIVALLAKRYGIPQDEIDGLVAECRQSDSRPVHPYWKKARKAA